jgi:hypothetical protein
MAGRRQEARLCVIEEVAASAVRLLSRYISVGADGDATERAICPPATTIKRGPLWITKGIDMNKPMNVVITAMFVISGCVSDSAHSPAPPDATVASTDQIQEVLSGKRLSSVTHKGNTFSMTFNPDGSEIFEEFGSQAQRERWEVVGDQVCISSPTYPRECSQVKVRGRDIWFVVPGTTRTRNHFTVQ